MLDSGYLFAKDEKRLFVNTSLGCSGGCSYCYLNEVGYSNNDANKVITADEIISFLEKSNYKLSADTLITIGCFSECFDKNNKDETIKIIKYFLSKGNQVQLSTKKKISKDDMSDILPLIKYYGQLVIFISSTTISKHDLFEKNTDAIDMRFKSFELLKENIPVVLYLKPVLKDVTYKDIDLYKNYINKYKIDYVVVGSIFTDKESNETVHFSNDNKLFYNPINDEEKIINELSTICHVFSRSTDITTLFKTERNK